MKAKQVVAAIITRPSPGSSSAGGLSYADGSACAPGSSPSPSPLILATQRGHGDYKDWWEFPGGKIEAGETAEEALIREIREELDTEIVIDELFCSVEYDYPDFHLYMDCFLCHIEEGKPRFVEHEAARWLAPEEYGSVKWLGADIEVLRKLKERFGAAGGGCKDGLC